MIPEVQNRDGALYADVTPTSLGLPVYTPMCHIPIPYSIYWKQFGEMFEEQAKATCPVDTGYLRAHIGYQADSGGCEIWSDAPYSAYQEYGTSRMRAQPYFEAALVNAYTEVEGSMRALADEFMDNDADLFFLTNRCGREGTLEECYADLQRLDKIIAFMQKSNASTAAEAGWYYDLTPLIDAREEIYTRMQQLQEIEAMRKAQGLGGFLAELIGMMLAQLLMAPVTMFEIMLDDINAGNDAHHYPSH
jgi:HK97 gp10 family phage protein